MKSTPGTRIHLFPKPWNESRNPDPAKIRLEFPDLIRFKDSWFIALREGQIHSNHPSGQCRVLRSQDGQTWESASVLAWSGADVRDARLSITAEGRLMINTSLAFTNEKPDAEGHFTRLPDRPTTDAESVVTRQSLTWLSSDGSNWESANACPTGVNTWRWDATWHGGMGYSVAYSGKDTKGTLYRTRDGKSWRELKGSFFPLDSGCSEAALAFGEDDTAYCILRGNSERPLFLGVGQEPYYQNWRWSDVRFDVPAGVYVDFNDGGLVAAGGFCSSTHFGGPKIVRLNDGRLIIAGRVREARRHTGPWRVSDGDPEGKEDGRVLLFLLDPDEAVLRKIACVDGSSYPGVVEHDGVLWVTYIVTWGDHPGVYLAKVPLPN